MVDVLVARIHINVRTYFRTIYLYTDTHSPLEPGLHKSVFRYTVIITPRINHEFDRTCLVQYKIGSEQNGIYSLSGSLAQSFTRDRTVL